MSLPSYCVDPNAVLKENLDGIQWRNSLPNYDKVNELFDQCKTKNHCQGSLELIVQNLVKNWEKEASHKLNPSQWLTIDPRKYLFSCNGQETFNAIKVIEKGTYNVLIGQTNYYDSNEISFEESHRMFKNSLSNGFAWEVLEVYSSPPRVTFKWRHFGQMNERFSCRALSGHHYHVDPTKKMIELFGMCKATINDRFQIEELEVFYDPNQLFQQLTEISPFAPFESFSSHRENIPSISKSHLTFPQTSNHLTKKSSIDLEKKISNELIPSKHFSLEQKEKSSKISSKFCLIC